VLTAGFVLDLLDSVNCYLNLSLQVCLIFNIERFAVGLLGFSAPPGPLLHLVPFILLTTAGLFSDLQNARRHTRPKVLIITQKAHHKFILNIMLNSKKDLNINNKERAHVP
jgi:hypothetical protein